MKNGSFLASLKYIFKVTILRLKQKSGNLHIIFFTVIQDIFVTNSFILSSSLNILYLYYFCFDRLFFVLWIYLFRVQLRIQILCCHLYLLLLHPLHYLLLAQLCLLPALAGTLLHHSPPLFCEVLVDYV